jgi:hypothetical protein
MVMPVISTTGEWRFARLFDGLRWQNGEWKDKTVMTQKIASGDRVALFPFATFVDVNRPTFHCRINE